jgi:hypothetical protein
MATHVDDLPPEVLERVFTILSAQDFVRASGVCLHWHRVASRKEYWRDLYTDYFKNNYEGLLKQLKESVPPENPSLSHSDLDWRLYFRKTMEVDSNWKEGMAKVRILSGFHHPIRGIQLRGEMLAQTCGPSLQIYDLIVRPL